MFSQCRESSLLSWDVLVWLTELYISTPTYTLSAHIVRLNQTFEGWFAWPIYLLMNCFQIRTEEGILLLLCGEHSGRGGVNISGPTGNSLALSLPDRRVWDGLLPGAVCSEWVRTAFLVGGERGEAMYPAVTYSWDVMKNIQTSICNLKESCLVSVITFAADLYPESINHHNT